MLDKIKDKLPLKNYLRPSNLDDIVGQKHLIGENGVLTKMLKSNIFVSSIFWGDPGVGKTTIAKFIGEKLDFNFYPLNATKHRVSDIHTIAEKCKKSDLFSKGQNLIFVDEIHRFSKTQQDALLPYVEDGTFTFIGATTENPSFYVIPPLLSRCNTFKFNKLGEDDIGELVDSSIQKLGLKEGIISSKIIDQIKIISNGDGRKSIDLIELVLINDITTIDEFEKSIQSMSYYSKTGDNHFDIISAIQKSIRSSDDSATIFWIRKMLSLGEDPRYILRRLIRIAMEDVGLADPNALRVTNDAYRAFEILGVPEGNIALLQAGVYLALAPKSNALELSEYKADNIIKHNPLIEVPNHLRNAPTKFMKEQGFGEKYKYDHDFENGISDQKCMPEGFENISLYEPKNIGFESKLIERKNFISKIKFNNE